MHRARSHLECRDVLVPPLVWSSAESGVRVVLAIRWPGGSSQASLRSHVSEGIATHTISSIAVASLPC